MIYIPSEQLQEYKWDGYTWNRNGEQVKNQQSRMIEIIGIDVQPDMTLFTGKLINN